MLEVKNVKGNMETVKKIEFNIDTVYVRNNIIKVESEDFTGWQYDEIQYTYQEWTEFNTSKISILEAENEKLKQELSITQDAVNELIFNSLNI